MGTIETKWGRIAASTFAALLVLTGLGCAAEPEQIAAVEDTSTTAERTTSTEEQVTTTEAPTTTAAPTTTTEAPTTTTAPPPPPPPPTTTTTAYVPPPAPRAASKCDPNYSGGCVPVASDVDCAGGSGNGPAYVDGPVNVTGTDIYDLDADNDGLGCED